MGLAWLTDFGAAEAAGMALRLPLLPGTTSIDRLVVFGLRMSLDPAASAQRLAGLLDAHHYTDDAAFIPTGTPTNNRPTDKSAWTSRPSAAEAFDIERGTGSSDKPLPSPAPPYDPAPRLTEPRHPNPGQREPAAILDNKSKEGSL